MAQHPGWVVTGRRAWLLGGLAVGALVGRLPWVRFGVDAGDVPVGDAPVGWVLGRLPSAAQVGLALEFLLVWALVFAALPELYPSRARRLTAALPFRVAVAGLTTAASVVVFFSVTRQLSPVALLVLVASTLVVAVVVPSVTDSWRFATPYVSPAFAVLASFVPTDRVPGFAALFRRGTVDSRVRVACQALLGVVTVGFVLVTGALSALPTLAFPALELLTLGGLAVGLGHRLFPALPTRWRLRYARVTRRTRRRLWTARRLFTDLRGTASVLLVTAGGLLGASAGGLAVAVAVSAAHRTPLDGVVVPPTGVLTEWVVAGSLLGYTVSVAQFWCRACRWLPAFVAADRNRRTGRLHTNDAPAHDRPVGLLVPQAFLLVAALGALPSGGRPTVGFEVALGPGSGPALAATVCLLAASFATPWLHRLPRVAARLPALPDRLTLPVAFAVQWVGTSVALLTLPGTDLVSVAATTAFVLVVALGGYVYVDVRDVAARHDRRGLCLAYLLGLSVAAVGLGRIVMRPLVRLLVG
jgi:hypothetical protein